MTPRSLLLVVLLGGTFAWGAPAQPVEESHLSVGSMVPGCEAALEGLGTSDPLVAAANYCLGMTEGVSQSRWFNCVSTTRGFDPDPALAAGRPSSIAAALQAWVNWARAHPELWREPFSVSLTWALAEAFPCKR